MFNVNNSRLSTSEAWARCLIHWRCKIRYFFWYLQAFKRSDNTYMNLYEVIWTYTKLFALFSWLSPRFLVSLYSQTRKIRFTIMIKNNQSFSSNSQPSMGRMELAQAYFPAIQPRSAWLKFRSLLEDYPELSGFAKQKRRTYLPSEVNIIYQHLGQP